MSKLLLVFLLLPVLFLLVRRDVTYRAVLDHHNHTQVFEYLTNVSAFRELNPTIIEITHREKIGERDFYVEYTECLSQVPAVRNYGKAYYNVRFDDADGSYMLISRHFTCFYTDMLCLPTDSSLRVTKLSVSEVGYQEDISYTCPWPLLTFCFREVSFQRNEILSRLTEKFSG